MPLPQLPQALPKTQADWDRVFNVFQQWQQGLQAVKWQTPTLLNSWVNYGSPYEPPGYHMDASGVVHLRGMVRGGTAGDANSIFTLPAGYRPLYDVIVPAVAADAFAEVHVGGPNSALSTPPGAVVLAAGSTPSWLSLSGISFSTQ
jgi:hypothetical protein